MLLHFTREVLNFHCLGGLLLQLFKMLLSMLQLSLCKFLALL